MKNGKLSTGLIFAVLAAILFAACPVREATEETVVGEPREKSRSPITFELAKGTLLEKKYQERIEKDNKKLLALADEVKGGLTLDEAVWENRMSGTYLRTPMLIEDGKKYDNIKDVISRLNVIFAKPNVKMQKTHVALEYLPYGSEEWMRWNPEEDLDRNPEDEIDMIAHITTTFLHGSNPGNMDLSGEAPHRRNCDVI